RNVLEVVKLNVTEGALSIDPADEINQGSIAVNAPPPPPPPEEPTAEEAAPEDPAEPEEPEVPAGDEAPDEEGE
ncbi:MAG: hypothetical protein ABFS86_04760, partial [Planctomycetota bacterium]